MIIKERIVIARISKPAVKDVNKELQWFGDSLGLFSVRDKDKSCFRVFIELLKGAKQDLPLTSDQIAYKTRLTRGTVIHHLNTLMERGIVVHKKEGYLLRVDNLEELIKSLKRDTEKAISELSNAAKELDKELGL